MMAESPNTTLDPAPQTPPPADVSSEKSSCQMTPWIKSDCPIRLTIAKTLTLISLAVMVGGILVMGAIVAPYLFKAGLSHAQAALIMSELFSRFDCVLIGTMVFLVIGELLQTGWLKATQKKAVVIVRQALSILLVSTLLYGIFVMHPQIESYHKAGIKRGVGAEGQMFDRTHCNSETLMKADLALAVAMLVAIAI